jgi:molybdate transport system ATP-binding protein
MIEARIQLNRGSFSLDAKLSVPGRGVTALFGPSGSGKTTLLRAIAGLDRHADAYLKVGDTVWQDRGTFVPPHRRPLGYVFQEGSLFAHCSVIKNLEYGFKRIPHGSRRISLDRAVELFELSPLLDRRPTDLSGGEMRRVAIARALLTSPRLLLMDEPLSGLDLERKGTIMRILERLRDELDIPMLFVSHLPDEVAQLADHLIYIRNGTISAEGASEDVFSRLDLPLAHEPDAGVMIRTIAAARDEEYQLSRLEFDGGIFMVARDAGPIGRPVRIRIPARDVSLTLSRHSDTSILNVLPATVEEIVEGASAQVMVRLRVGGSLLLARITSKSAMALDLQPGKGVFAQVKSVALLDET